MPELRAGLATEVHCWISVVFKMFKTAFFSLILADQTVAADGLGGSCGPTV